MSESILNTTITLKNKHITPDIDLNVGDKVIPLYVHQNDYHSFLRVKVIEHNINADIILTDAAL